VFECSSLYKLTSGQLQQRCWSCVDFSGRLIMYEARHYGARRGSVKEMFRLRISDVMV